MTITTVYKLVSISNGMANFNITQIYTLTSQLKGVTIKAKGSGKGQMVYDIANNFYTRYQTGISMAFKAKVKNVDINVKLKSEYIQKTIISPNKD
jgi:hypothetical protein